jgi:Na+/proline symporter
VGARNNVRRRVAEGNGVANFFFIVVSVYYGPDSVHAEYIADTCSTLLGLPTCGMWNPDPQAFVKMMTHDVPPFLGGWCLVGIVAASMSTADGAILAMGTVFAHNIMRQFDGWFPHLVTPKNLVLVTRLVTIPLSLSSAFIATYYQSDNPAGATGYLLIVAFDVVLATVVVPLIGCFYAKNPRPSAAFLSIICGASTRMILEFVLPKDGYLVLPFDGPEYLNYGPAASTRLPTFIDGNATEVWNPATEPCDQGRFEDYTGLDSLTSLFVSLIVYVSVQTIENATGKPLFTFSGLEGYIKENVGHKSMEETLEKSPDDTKASGETYVKEEADASVKDADEVADS